VETSRPNIDRRRHRLSLSVPEPSPRIAGDQARLTQVIANLLNNAAKFQNDDGVVELQVTIEGTEAVIKVRDEGFGIAPEGLHGLFSLFSQGERSPASEHGGLGVGLSLAKTLVEMHGGSVSAWSEGVGKGSEFTVRLPSLQAVSLPSTDLAAAEGVPGSRRRILVVDDSRDAAETLALLLELDGHDVLIAHDGHRALELAMLERPAVMLLDIGLPGMDGYEVCRRARAEGLSDTTIIAMTGYGQEKDRQRSSEAGFDGHTVKPVEMAELSRIIAAIPSRS
jgi:CheY-like chemotaxis protein